MHPNKKTTAEEDEQILECYRQGMALRMIAVTFSVDVKTVGNRLRKHGYKLRQPRTEWPEEDIRHLFVDEGYSLPQIAEMLGIEKLTGLHGLVERRGWKINPVPKRPKCGPTHGNWKGGRTIQQGYVVVKMPGHSRANINGYVREHILVMEQMLGRPLAEGEVVHHKDHNRQNNLPDNLQLCASQSEHQRKYHSVKPPVSEETREKVRQSALAQWRRRKEFGELTAIGHQRKASGEPASP